MALIERSPDQCLLERLQRCQQNRDISRSQTTSNSEKPVTSTPHLTHPGLTVNEEDEDEDVKTCVDTDYATQFFNIQYTLKEDYILTDFSFIQGTRRFECHSIILAAVSSLVQKHLQEGECDEICLDEEVSSVGLEAVIAYAYKGEMNLDNETVAEVMKAAKYLGVPRMIELCTRFQESSKTVDEWKPLSSDICLANLRSIKDLWSQNVGCDIQLQVDGHTFSAHRTVLAAGSDYFRAMFTIGMKEAGESNIQIQAVNSKNVSDLLSFMYTGSLCISWEHIFDLTSTSMQLQVVRAIPLCFDFFRKEINAEECLDIKAFAEAFNFNDLKEHAEDFILSNFEEVASVPKFEDLSLHQLLYYLSHNALCIANELEAFRIAVNWINANKSERMCYAAEIMQVIRFPLMTFSQIKEVRATNTKLVEEGWEDIYEAALNQFGWTQDAIQQYCRVRQPRQVMVLVGGYELSENLDKHVASKNLWFANSFKSGIGLIRDIEWQHLSNLPDLPRFSHSLVVLNNILYIFAGSHYHGKQDVLKSAVRYDPMQNTWKEIAPLNEGRYSTVAVCRNDLIYILGGDTVAGENVDSVECYDPASNTWRYVHPLDQPLSGHAAEVWNGEIFVSGGFNCQYQCLVSMFTYSPDVGTTYLSSMNEDRAEHIMETIKDKFYVAGGRRSFGGSYLNQYLCEVYDPYTDTWASIAKQSTPHVAAASSVLDEKLYVLGGQCCETNKDSHRVSAYNPRSSAWEPAETDSMRILIIKTT
ncbi:kelch-like protein 33 isoform X2 [Protopterus annectens]|uniref:kelch-like protein 33 isoform X2 n=1 Tax=Protopterus annectens TaxID=7888 RepID=UPI001CF954EE|nr:kelch-like protein 33 isoform X2 [Protopterus annectens]